MTQRRTPEAALLSSRLSAQLLAGHTPESIVDTTRHMLAVQAQDLRAARLALRVRSGARHASDLDHGLTHERSLLVTWVNRGTLHLIAAEDEPLLHRLTTPQLQTANDRRLSQEGVDPAAAQRGVDTIVARLRSDGALTRPQIREALERAGVPVSGQALVHILFRATLDGHIVRGPMVGSDQAFVLVEDWLGKRPRLERDRALSELALRYLRAHGPAGERDLAKWAQLPLRDVRAGLGSIADRLTEVDRGLWDLRRRETRPLPPPRLLGPFDPLLLGWASRSFILDDPSPVVVTTNGIIKAVVLLGGRAGGTWSRPGGRVQLDLWSSPSATVSAALAQEAAAVERYLSASPRELWQGSADGDR